MESVARPVIEKLAWEKAGFSPAPAEWTKVTSDVTRVAAWHNVRGLLECENSWPGSGAWLFRHGTHAIIRKLSRDLGHSAQSFMRSAGPVSGIFRPREAHACLVVPPRHHAVLTS